MKKRRQGVKKDDTVEKRVTGGGSYKVHGTRYKEEENPKSEARNPKQARSSNDQNSKRGMTGAQTYIRLVFWILIFEFVARFEFRDSGLDR